jgi:2-hydroxy-3-keto-5-methylthiopentenyl-1-phosphate phosphatase
MAQRKKPIIAICYDFDGTLAPGNMQEYDYIPKLGLNSPDFWKSVNKRAQGQKADEILAYMGLMIEKATPESNVRVTKDAFKECGKNVELFPGVEQWFERITQFGKEQGARIEHYIISSGIKEMIEGTRIGNKFKEIFASSFMYNQNGVAYWPALAVNYTTKTQFLFRINKGILNVWDNSRINSYIPKDERPVPFTQIIYIGDGSTDIPCMKLVKDQGGYSIAVYKPKSKKKTSAEKLIKDDRVCFTAPADYTEGSQLDLQIRAVIEKMISVLKVQKGETLANSMRSRNLRK